MSDPEISGSVGMSSAAPTTPSPSSSTQVCEPSSVELRALDLAERSVRAAEVVNAERKAALGLLHGILANVPSNLILSHYGPARREDGRIVDGDAKLSQACRYITEVVLRVQEQVRADDALRPDWMAPPQGSATPTKNGEGA